MLVIIREGIFLFIAVVVQYLLLEKKYGVRFTILCLIPCVSIVFLMNAFFILRVNPAIFIHVYPLTVVLPVSLPLILLSKYKGFKVLFNILTALFLGVVIRIIGFYFSALFSYSDFSSMIGQLLAFPFILLFLLKKLRPPYMEIISLLQKGWATFCLVPLFSYVLIYFIYRHPSFEGNRASSYVPILVIIVITILFYLIIISFFSQIQLRLSLQNEQNLLSTQVSSLQSQLFSLKNAEERMQILLHDARHHSQTVASLIGSGEMDKALDYISQFNSSLDDMKVPVYCENPTINAVLSFNIESARKEGITVKTRLDIPLKTSVDAVELSSVIANAMENARNACSLMPPDSKPSIELVCVSRQMFVFECANTYAGKVDFDKDGLPVSRLEDHGIGTKSIAAFARKHNAILDYQADGGIFRMRILLQRTVS